MFDVKIPHGFGVYHWWSQTLTRMVQGQWQFLDTQYRVGIRMLDALRGEEAGPGSAPALSGPTAMRCMRSTRAIEPPPAPISTISITGTRTGSPLPFTFR